MKTISSAPLDFIGRPRPRVSAKKAPNTGSPTVVTRSQGAHGPGWQTSAQVCRPQSRSRPQVPPHDGVLNRDSQRRRTVVAPQWQVEAGAIDGHGPHGPG